MYSSMLPRSLWLFLWKVARLWITFLFGTKYLPNSCRALSKLFCCSSVQRELTAEDWSFSASVPIPWIKLLTWVGPSSLSSLDARWYEATTPCCPSSGFMKVETGGRFKSWHLSRLVFHLYLLGYTVGKNELFTHYFIQFTSDTMSCLFTYCMYRWDTDFRPSNSKHWSDLGERVWLLLANQMTPRMGKRNNLPWW